MTVGGLLEPADFFVLRTPLLSFDDFLNWGASDAPVAALDAVWREPQVGEAVFVATPELDAALERSQNAGATNDAAIRARRSPVAYFTRMCSRSTPFGLFAGCSVGTPGPHTRLELAPVERYQRHTRLDMDYLIALTRALEADSSVRASLRFSPNSSLYRAGGRQHYAESRLSIQGRSYHLVAVDESPELIATLARARDDAAPRAGGGGAACSRTRR